MQGSPRVLLFLAEPHTLPVSARRALQLSRPVWLPRQGADRPEERAPKDSGASCIDDIIVPTPARRPGRGELS